MLLVIHKGYKMMVREHRNNSDDQLVTQTSSQEKIETLLDLSIKWNSLEGLKQMLRDINKEPTQVSPFSRLLSSEYASLLTRIIHSRIYFPSFRLQFCAVKIQS